MKPTTDNSEQKRVIPRIELADKRGSAFNPYRRFDRRMMSWLEIEFEKTQDVFAFSLNRLAIFAKKERPTRPCIPSKLAAISKLPCAACSSPPPSCIDHIFPWSKGGPTLAVNLQPLCARCNHIKGSQVMTLDRVRELIKRNDLRKKGIWK